MAASVPTCQQQTSGANTLIVSSPIILPSSASQLSSINSSSGLTSSTSSLIASSSLAQSHLHQQHQPILQVFQPQQEPFQVQQFYQHHPSHMFLPSNLTIQNMHSAPHQQANTEITTHKTQKKKIGKGQKFLSKNQNDHNTQKTAITSNANTMIKLATMVPAGAQQFSQNNQQTVVISQLPPILPNSQQPIIAPNKNLLEQKGKQFMLHPSNSIIQPKSQILQNTAITSQSLIGPHFKTPIQSNNHLIASQPSIINQTQLLGPIQQIPQSLAWANSGQPLIASNSQIFIRPQAQANGDGQSLFIQESNPHHQTVSGTPIYVNHNTGLMQFVQANPQTNLNNLHQQILTTSSNPSINSIANHTSVTNTTQSKSNCNLNTNISTTKLKNIRPASVTSNLQNSNSTKQVKHIVSKNAVSQINKKQETKQDLNLNSNNLSKVSKSNLTKTTQQMNAELLMSANNNNNNNSNPNSNIKCKQLVKSDSMKSLEKTEQGKKNENKLFKKLERKDSLDSLVENDSFKSSTNGASKKEKSEKKNKHIQKAVVRPQILTHCIDGHVIQESSFPFPINGVLEDKTAEKTNSESVYDFDKDCKLENKKLDTSTDLREHKIQNTPKEQKIKSKKLKKSKSKAAAPNNLNNTESSQFDPKNINEVQENNLSFDVINKPQENSQNKDQIKIVPMLKKTNVVSVAPINEANNKTDNNLTNVYQWSVNDVFEYVQKIASTEFANILRDQLIDGKALMLLTIAILREDFKLKLGPILLLNEKINELKKIFGSEVFQNDYLPSSGSNIYKWSVKDVYDFILNLSSREYAEEFEKQEMDGHALTLLSQENIIKDMNILYGPGLKILSRIKELKEKSSSN